MTNEYDNATEACECKELSSHPDITAEEVIQEYADLTEDIFETSVRILKSYYSDINSKNDKIAAANRKCNKFKILFGLSIAVICILTISLITLNNKRLSILDENSSLVLEIEDKDATISELQSFKDKAEEGKWEKKVTFYDENIVFVTPTGSKYHRLTCQYMENSRFAAYNVGGAIFYGYAPCSVCKPSHY